MSTQFIIRYCSQEHYGPEPSITLFRSKQVPPPSSPPPPPHQDDLVASMNVMRLGMCVSGPPYRALSWPD
ncbi:hypothetical protein M0802_008820 [Mischocyttarus mexicanus]|nr:hypothetical protein M0802_008820 [Mischocyttarus mexicanus]